MRDDADFAEYVTANAGRLLRIAYLITGSRAAAEDVVQTVLGRALLSWSRIAASKPDAYLRRAIVNEKTSLWRRVGRREVITSTPPDRIVPDGTRAGDSDDLMQALRQLPKKQRAAVVLRYLEGLADDEIASILECSPATVRSQVSRGLVKLRAELAIEPASLGEERVTSHD